LDDAARGRLVSRFLDFGCRTPVFFFFFFLVIARVHPSSFTTTPVLRSVLPFSMRFLVLLRPHALYRMVCWTTGCTFCARFSRGARALVLPKNCCTHALPDGCAKASTGCLKKNSTFTPSSFARFLCGFSASFRFASDTFTSFVTRSCAARVRTTFSGSAFPAPLFAQFSPARKTLRLLPGAFVPLLTRLSVSFHHCVGTHLLHTVLRVLVFRTFSLDNVPKTFSHRVRRRSVAVRGCRRFKRSRRFVHARGCVCLRSRSQFVLVRSTFGRCACSAFIVLVRARVALRVPRKRTFGVVPRRVATRAGYIYAT